MDKKLLEALSARAEQKREAKTQAKKFYVGGMALDFVQPSLEVKLSYAEALTAENPADTVRACASLIYDCCPALQSPELHAALGVTDPYDTVWALMDVAEVNRLALEVYEWLGLVPRDEDEDPVKN